MPADICWCLKSDVSFRACSLFRHLYCLAEALESSDTSVDTDECSLESPSEPESPPESASPLKSSSSSEFCEPSRDGLRRPEEDRRTEDS